MTIAATIWLIAGILWLVNIILSASVLATGRGTGFNVFWLILSIVMTAVSTFMVVALSGGVS